MLAAPRKRLPDADEGRRMRADNAAVAEISRTIASSARLRSRLPVLLLSLGSLAIFFYYIIREEGYVEFLLRIILGYLFYSD